MSFLTGYSARIILVSLLGLYLINAYISESWEKSSRLLEEKKNEMVEQTSVSLGVSVAKQVAATRAVFTKDIVKSLNMLSETEVETLDIDDEYYREVFSRVPNVTEDHKVLQEHNILVDGDEEGYLLQIFTKNVVGPIFIEIIQRKNHNSFGEGNFGALFRSIT